jgi:hypothetical protein
MVSVLEAAPNNSFNRSGISVPLVEALPHDVVVSRLVNSGVRPLLEN